MRAAAGFVSLDGNVFSKKDAQERYVNYREIVVLPSVDGRLIKFQLTSQRMFTALINVAFSEDVFGGCCWGAATSSLLYAAECLMHQILICHSFIVGSSVILRVMWLTGEMRSTSALSAEICFSGLKWGFGFHFPPRCIAKSDKLIYSVVTKCFSAQL